MQISQVAPPCPGTLSWRWTYTLSSHIFQASMIQCIHSHIGYALTGFTERVRDGESESCRMRSHLALVGLITCLRNLGDCLILPQASTIRLAAVCPSPRFLLPLLWLSSYCRYSCLNVPQHKWCAGHALHPQLNFKLECFTLLSSSYACPVAFFLIPLMYISTSLYFSLLFFLVISHVWYGCPADDDLSGQSYYPFGIKESQ